MIEIPKSGTADTRTCDYANVTQDTLYRSSHQHILDVRRALGYFGWLLQDAAARHDFDKLSDIEGFHKDFLTGFKVTEWWDRHRVLNRHHLMQADGVPQDVNLIDVLDMIADCVMAGMARSGSVYPLIIPVDVLRVAFENTVALLRANVKVLGETPAPPQEHLSGVNDDYYMPGHKHETKETPIMDPIIDVQTTLDDWLNNNPDAQLYVRKIYYLPDGSEIPREVTHMNRLTSIAYPNLDLRLGVVATAKTAALANVILGLIERSAGDRPTPKA